MNMKKTYNQILQASLFVAVSGILYGFLGFFGTQLIQDNVSISAMLFWRFLIAGIWMFIFVIVLPSESAIPHQKSSLLRMFTLGAICYAASSGFYFIASQYTGTGLAMVLFFSYPMMVAFFSWILKQLTPNKITWMILCAMMVGLLLLKGSDSAEQLSVIGIGFGIIAAVFYALYVMGSKHLSLMAISPNMLAMMVCFGCAAIFLGLSILSSSFVMPHSMKNWLYYLALGILATAIPIQCMLIGLKYISSMRASIISVLEPLVTLFLGVTLLNEPISHAQMLGVLLVLVSALLIQFQKNV